MWDYICWTVWILYYVVLPLIGLLILAGLIHLRRRAHPFYSYKVIPANKQSVIVITGCDSGIGRSTCEILAKKGYYVLASIFTDKGKEELEAFSSGLGTGCVEPVFCDITKQDSVDSFADRVRSVLGEGRVLAGVVNNAGAAWSGPVEFQPVQDFEKQLNVNLIGHFRVVQKMIPFLRESGGRIVNVASVAGKVALPSMAAYAVSKFGMEALSDTLRRELRPWRVSVSIIEPGWVATPLVSGTINRFEEDWDKLGEECKSVYHHDYLFAKNYLPEAFKSAIQPSVVGNAIAHALTSPSPKTRYPLGVTAWLPIILQYALPTRMYDEISYILQDKMSNK